MNKVTPSLLYRYGLVVAGVVLAAAVRRWLDPLLNHLSPFALLLFVVLLAAGYGGRGPALLATVLGALVSARFLLSPRDSFAVEGIGNQTGLVLYLAVGAGITLLGGAMHAARRRAEEKTREAVRQQEQLRIMFASIGDAVIVADAGGRVTTMNPVAEALTGWPAREAVGQSLEAVFPIINEQTRQALEGPLARVLRAGTAVHPAHQTLLIARDGTERPIDDSAAPIRNRRGELAGVVLIFRDVTERRRADEARRRLAAIVESSDDAILGKRLDGIITNWNRAAERLYGYTAGEIVGRPVTLLVPEDQAADHAVIMERLKQGEAIDHSETVRRRKDGTLIDVSVSISPIRDAAGQIVGASTIARDISDRRRAEGRRNARLAVTQILARAADLTDAAPQILQAACEGLGWTVGGLWVVDRQEDRLRCLDVWHLPGVSVPRFEATTRRIAFGPGESLPGRVWKDGKPLWVHDVAEDDRLDRRQIAAEEGLHGGFACPICGDGAVLGVVEFFSSEIREPDPDLLEMMATLGGQIGLFVERSRAVEQLRRNERELADFFDNASVGLHWVGPDGTILRANRAELGLLGYAREEYVGRPISEFHADEARIGEILRRLQAGETLHDCPARLRCKDGSIRDVLIDSGVMWEDGRFVHTRCITRDVTETRRAEAALRESEERFRLLTEVIPPLVWSSLPDGSIDYCNPRWLAYTGLTLEQVRGHGWDVALHPDDRESTLSAWREAAATGGQFQVEQRLRGEDGRYRWFLTRALPFRDEAGVPRRWFGSCTDVDDQKRAKQALADSEERLRLALDAGRMGVWDWNLLNDRIEWSENLEAIHGLVPGTFDGRFETFRELIHPEDRDRVLGAIAGAREGQSGYDIEFRLVRPDGSLRWMSGKGKVFSDGGRPTRMIGVGLDITDRKRAEHDTRFLADASASLAALVDYESTLRKVAGLAVPSFADWCSVDMLDPSGSLRRVAVSHVDPDKVELALEWSRRSPPDPAAPNGVWNVVRSGTSEIVAEIDDDLLATSVRDPELLQVLRQLGLRSYMAVPLVAHGKVLGVIQFVAAESGRRYEARDLALAGDLAHRAAVAIENSRLYQEVREADLRKDEFLAVLAHELRNPLAPIRNALEILRRTEDDPEARAQARSTMERQLKQMVRLIDDLMDVSRIGCDKLELRKERDELAAVVRDAVEASRPLVEEAGHELTVMLPDAPVTIDADPARLAQVISNLLNNASKYTEPGGRIALTARCEGSDLVVSVRDNGVGIPAEMLPRVFEIFTQVDRSLERSRSGLGIGLTLVRRLVVMHGGTVEAHSEGPGRGSTFVVRLPVVVVRSETEAQTETEQAPESAPSRDGPGIATRVRRILVVDDSRDSARTLARLLKLAGNEVEIAHDGREAIASAASFRPDVVLLDIGLPVLNGYDAARQIREHDWGRAMVLVALTGWGQDGDRRRSKEAGFDHHLVKPVDPGALLRLLDEWSVASPETRAEGPLRSAQPR